MSLATLLLLSSTFILRVIGDLQVADMQEVEYASRSLFPELLVPSETPTYNLFMGDQVNTDLSLLPVVSQLLHQLPDPCYTVAGNHDRDLTGPATPQDSTYRSVFGSPYYSFDRGNVHFMVLNNVFPQGKRGYRGRVTDEQLDWLRTDVAAQPRARQLVLAMHIPAALTSNADSLFQVFEQHKAKHLLVLSGHLHQVMRQVQTRPSGLTVQEVSVGAACGSWWTGEKDHFGVPSARMHCGTPRGYFCFEFTKASYRFHYKGIGLDPSHQMDVWVAGLDSADQHIDTLALRSVGDVYATVYGACDDTQVCCQLDDGTWIQGERVEVMDASIARLRQQNTDKEYPTRFSRMNPIRNRPSQQVWRFRFNPEQLQGTHLLRLRASDSWGFEAQGTKLFFLPTQ